MFDQRGRKCLVIAVALIIGNSAATAEERLWTDEDGEFSTMAEFVRLERGNAVLRQQDGREISVPLRKLSDRDRTFIRSQRAKQHAKPQDEGPAHVAEDFFYELRSEKRDAAVEMLTPKAKEQIKQAKIQTPLAELPTPEEGNRAIRIGRAAIEGTTAVVPVQVRVAGKMHKTKLHLRQEGDDWFVFALTAILPNGERHFDFEAPPGKEGASPLDALVGQPFTLAGMTLDGRPFDGSQYQGKVVLVDFFATTSNPSLEMANIAANYQKYGPTGFAVIGVSVDQDVEALAEFLGRQKPPWPVLVDNFSGPRNSMAARYGIMSPTSILVGRDGKVAAVNCRGEALGKELAKLTATGANNGQAQNATQGPDPVSDSPPRRTGNP